MKSLTVAILLFTSAISCWGQSACSQHAVLSAAAKVLQIQAALKQIKLEEMDTNVPPQIADKMGELKDGLSSLSSAIVNCPKVNMRPSNLQKQLATVLRANAPEPPANTSISEDDPRYAEITGSYGHNLRVKVEFPPRFPGLLAIHYTINIECGTDSMLLIYAHQNGQWMQRVRWQSPPLRETSDAFGDFFVYGLLGGPSDWKVVVAHGTPWCTSRFSGFKLDLLEPRTDSPTPKILWYINRSYSRFDFDPLLKTEGNIFELRLNADCMWFDNSDCFERRVVYRYEVEKSGKVRRVNPLAINARGFVEEWLAAPWSESKDFTDLRSVTSLQTIHDQFDPPSKPHDDQFRSHTLGPVRACKTLGIYQVQINSTLERIVPGKPGGESKPLPSLYFHVQEVKDGYMMVSAPVQPDSTCFGPNLMPEPRQ